MKIGVDAMGGDFAPKITVLGAMAAIKKFDDIEIVLYGKEEEIKKYLTDDTRITIKNCNEVISMGEKDPVKIVRSNLDYSLVEALKDGKDLKVDAVVSSGPTQAVVAISRLIVKPMKGMRRVALGPVIPSLDGKGKFLLDAGANVELNAENIDQLAYFATVVAENALGWKNPKVGLVNIGEEPGKGRQVDKEAYELLKADKRINFFGNIEPKEMHFVDCDIFVTDGFSGNILMKSMEGTAKMMSVMLKEEIKRNTRGKIGYLFMKKNLDKFKKRFDVTEVGGAMVCGVNIPIVKAHGNSDEYAFSNAIRLARGMVKNDVIGKVKAGLGELGE